MYNVIIIIEKFLNFRGFSTGVPNIYIWMRTQARAPLFNIRLENFENHPREIIAPD